MTTKINLLCDVFPIGEAYETDKLYFALSLAPAFSAVPSGLERERVEKLLSPWTWTIHGFKVVLYDSTFASVADFVAPPVPLPSPYDSTQPPYSDWIMQQLQNKRDKVFLDGGYTPSVFEYQIETDPSTSVLRDVYANDAAVDHKNLLWHAYLMNLSLEPFPLPHLANLVSFFKIDKPQDTTLSLFATPQITFNDFGGGLRLEPQGLPFPRAGFPISDRFRQWDYNADPTLEMKSFSAYCPVLPFTPQNSSIALDTGWMNPGAGNVFAGEWSEGLREKVSPLFDIPSIVLKHASTDASADMDPWKSKMVVYGIADLAGIGITPTSNSYPFSLHKLIFDSIIRKNKKYSVQKWAPVSQALADWWVLMANDTTSAFQRWIQSFGEKEKIWDPIYQASSVSRVNQIYKTMSDNALLAELVLLSWDEALAKANSGTTKPILAEFWNQELRDLLKTEILPTINFLQRRRSELVEPAWKIVLNYQLPQDFEYAILHTAPNQQSDWTADSQQIRLDLIAASTDQKMFVARLLVALTTYFKDRFSSANTAIKEYSTALPNGASIESEVNGYLASSDFDQMLREHVATYCVEMIFKPCSQLSSAPLTACAEQIAFTIDDFGERPDPTTGIVDPAKDFRRFVNGVGLLIKEDDPNKQEWHCANLADIGWNLANDPGLVSYDPDDVVGFGSVIPLTLHETDGLRRCSVIYSGRPLVGSHPASLVNDGGFVGVSDGTFRSDALYSLRDAYSDQTQYTSRGHRLARLKYGSTYLAKAFVVRKGGALPKEIVLPDPQDATLPKFPAMVDKAKALTASNSFTATFKRRVAFAPPSLKESGSAGKKAFPFPRVPDNVYPLAGSLLKGAPNSDEKLKQLLLLSVENLQDARSKQSFDVYFPSVDFDVWKHDPLITQANFKAGFFDCYKYRNSLNAQQNVPTPPGQSLTFSLDDSQVDALVFRLRCINDSTSTDEIVLRAQADATPYPKAKAPSVEVTAKKQGNVRNTYDQAINVLTVEVLVGNVYELQVFAAIDQQKDVQFEDSLKLTSEGTYVKGGITYNLFSPQEILLEVVAFEMPSHKTIQECLYAEATAALGQASGGPQNKPSEVNFSFDTSLATDPLQQKTLVNLVSRFELSVQRWRWNGRPLPNSPDFLSDFEVAFASNEWTSANKWDGVLFGERFDDDVRVQESRADLVSQSGPHLLLKQDISNDLSAHYYRYSVRAFSRYEGLSSSTSVDSRFDAVVANNANEFEWHRIAIPARISESPQQPAVRMVIPLTEPLPEKPSPTANDTPSVPGLLVVLDEPWFQRGGIGERLQAKVGLALCPRFEDHSGEMNEPLDHPRLIREMGPDPILSMDAIFQYNLGEPEVIGPIGYTFDSNTFAPRFVHSSFIVKPPMVSDPASGQTVKLDLSWYMAKLQFARSIPFVFSKYDNYNPISSYSMNTARSSTQLQNIITQERVSAFTPGTWCQFLPPSSQYYWGTPPIVPSTVKVLLGMKQLEFYAQITVSTEQLALKSSGSIVCPKHLEGKKCEFKYLALVTQLATDAFGLEGRETFYGLFSFDEQTGELIRQYPIVRPPVPSKDCQLKLRLMEVQIHANELSAHGTDWPLRLMLGYISSEGDVPQSRIVRVSEPCIQSG